MVMTKLVICIELIGSVLLILKSSRTNARTSLEKHRVSLAWLILGFGQCWAKILDLGLTFWFWVINLWFVCFTSWAWLGQYVCFVFYFWPIISIIIGLYFSLIICLFLMPNSLLVSNFTHSTFFFFFEV